MSSTVQSRRNLIPIEEPEWISLDQMNRWKVIYKPIHIFKISECYLDEAEITRQILSLNTNYSINIDTQNETYEEKVRSLFAKFKDFEVNNVKLEINVDNRTVNNPLIQEYETMFGNMLPVDGVCQLTFTFMKYTTDNILVPTQVRLKNFPVQAKLEKTNNIYHWKLYLDSKIIYYQILVIVNSTSNLENTFLEFNNLERKKIDDITLFLNKINQSIITRKNTYMYS